MSFLQRHVQGLYHVLKCGFCFIHYTYLIATTHPNLNLDLKCGSTGFTIVVYVFTWFIYLVLSVYLLVWRSQYTCLRDLALFWTLTYWSMYSYPEIKFYIRVTELLYLRIIRLTSKDLVSPCHMAALMQVYRRHDSKIRLIEGILWDAKNSLYKVDFWFMSSIDLHKSPRLGTLKKLPFSSFTPQSVIEEIFDSKRLTYSLSKIKIQNFKIVD